MDLLLRQKDGFAEGQRTKDERRRMKDEGRRTKDKKDERRRMKTKDKGYQPLDPG
jgi:hypothetical protein